MKTKVLMASSVWLSGVPAGHRSHNGSCQYLIVARVPSKKRLAELVGGTVRHLTEYGCGIAAPQYQNIPKRDDVIYYRVEHSVSGFINEWFEYERPDWLQKINP